MALSQTSVSKLYNAVVDDVIAGVRDKFLDDGVDEQVLQELQQLWRAKLQATGVMDPPQQLEAHPPPIVQNYQRANGNVSQGIKRSHPESGSQQINHSNQLHQAAGSSSNVPNRNLIGLDPNNKVPVQLTLPAQPGVQGSTPRVFTIQIPASALNGNQLHQVLTGPIISATMNLPEPLAATLLQQHINATLAGQQNNLEAGPTKTWRGTDGANDSSDDDAVSVGGSNVGSDVPVDDDDDDFDDDAANEDEENEEGDGEPEGPEEEPLNSGDDVSDEEPGDMFDTDNVVVCQYDKITRSRNRWKFYLKDGIMTLSGKDFVFQKANGDAEW